MTARDHKKLADQGFVIIRRLDYPQPHIRCKSRENPTSWRKYTDDCSSKAARDRIARELLKNDDIVED